MFITETLPACTSARIEWCDPHQLLCKLADWSVYQAWSGNATRFPEEDEIGGMPAHLSAISTPEAAQALGDVVNAEMPCRPRGPQCLAPGEWCVWAPVGSNVWALVSQP